MAKVIVLGAGMNGLATAMMLDKDGHDVTVLERDAGHAPDDPHGAWVAWERQGVNQFRLPHFMLARWRTLVERELPEVVTCLEELGALRLNAFESHPSRRGRCRPDDARFDCLTARRPTLEVALSKAAETIDVRRGVAVHGLVAGSATGGVPHVTGVVTDAGVVSADLVVDCGGRRSAISAWIADIDGGPVAEEREDSGFVYFGRHLRSISGEIPPFLASPLTNHDSLSLLTLPADNGTWSVAVVASADDRLLRSLRHVDTWERVAKCYPHLAPWLAGEPLTDVVVMASIEDRIRRFVIDGVPAATGVVAVGDAWACTNPSLGRGASIGFEHAMCLRDLLREIDPSARDDFVLRFAAITTDTVEPRYRSTVAFDRHRLAEMRADVAQSAYQTDDPAWLMSKALEAAAAAADDDEVLRSRLAIVHLLATPDEIVTAPGMVDKIIALGAGAPQYVDGGLTRDELVVAASD